MGVEAGNDLGSWFQLLRDLWFQVGSLDAPYSTMAEKEDMLA